mmetsp:Transcript_12947/g.31498  ORF Transcript_12947/g.31498 Transcript_12947/m.31498 type:complete len:516 (+) Transcript_12947:671-2218(+)
MFQDWVKQVDTHESSSDGANGSVEEGVIDFTVSPVESSFESYQQHDDTASTAAVLDGPKNNRSDGGRGRRRSSDKSWYSSLFCYSKTQSRSSRNTTPFFYSPKQRRRVLCSCAVIIAICVIVGTTVPMVMKGSSDTQNTSSSESSSPGENNVAEESGESGFDFTGVNSTGPIPALSPTTASPIPTISPTTASPTVIPSDIPSSAPTVAITSSPTSSNAPSSMPSTVPTSSPTAPIPRVAPPPILPLVNTSDTLLTFCVIADVPYDKDELKALPGQIETQMEGCEFLVHLGDLFIGDTDCEEQSYYEIRDVMLASNVPTFVVVGDNEWNDCVKNRIDAGWELWNQEFLRFENKWNHTMTVVRQPGFEENFYFVEKRTLIIGLNLVGGRVHNSSEWRSRQEAEYAWTRNVINTFVPQFADGVIIMAHAKPSADQRFFMDPLGEDMANTWQNKFPILYLHGDGHSWTYNPHFKRQHNMLRVQHEGGVRDPILKVLADPAKNGPEVYSAFQFDRQLELA